MAVYYKTNNNDNQLNLIFFDLISDNLCKNGWWVCQALNFIFQSSQWQQLSPKNLFFWMDNGPHFKTYEVARFLFTIPKVYNYNIEWNFFVEGHGKSICDTHFSKVIISIKKL